MSQPKIPRTPRPIDHGDHAPSFNVVVEKSIGVVTMGSEGKHPFLAALDLIQEHAFETLEGGTQHATLSYSFPGADHGEVVQVSIGVKG